MLPTEILSKLRSAYADPFYPCDKPAESVPIYNSATGDVLRRIEAPGMIRISRGRMYELCAKDLDVRYRKRLVDIVIKEDGSGVLARFEDESEVEGDLMMLGKQGRGSGDCYGS